jgi:hypothetical protein
MFCFFEIFDAKFFQKKRLFQEKQEKNAKNASFHGSNLHFSIDKGLRTVIK